MLRRLSLLLVSAAVFAVVFAVGAAAADGTADSGTAAGGEQSKPVKMKLQVSAKRFRVVGKRVYARGPMTLRANEAQGAEETLKERVQMRVTASGKGGSSCKVITLHLAELKVELLGLLVNTSEVNLDVKGVRKRALGKLFCNLSEGLKLNKKALARKAAHSLNQRIAERDMNVLAVNANLHAQQAQASYAENPVCTILDLDLGPLELDLLGLFVHLYGDTKKQPVHVDADADPNGGVLGETLCELSGGPDQEPQQ